MAEGARLTDTVQDLLESGRRERLGQILEDAHAADIAAVLRDLTLAEQVTVFRLLGRELAGEVLAELDDQPLHELARALDEGEISSILDRMRPDDAAQVLEDLPAEQAEKVLDLMKEERSEEVQEILEYGEKTAGRLMSPDFLAVHEHLTVAQAVEQVRKSSGRRDRLHPLRGGRPRPPGRQPALAPTGHRRPDRAGPLPPAGGRSG